jgi:hypothetical protein
VFSWLGCFLVGRDEEGKITWAWSHRKLDAEIGKVLGSNKFSEFLCARLGGQKNGKPVGASFYPADETFVGASLVSRSLQCGGVSLQIRVSLRDEQTKYGRFLLLLGDVNNVSAFGSPEEGFQFRIHESLSAAISHARKPQCAEILGKPFGLLWLGSIFRDVYDSGSPLLELVVAEIPWKLALHALNVSKPIQAIQGTLGTAALEEFNLKHSAKRYRVPANMVENAEVYVFHHQIS